MSNTNARKSRTVSTRACRAFQTDLDAWSEAVSVFEELLRRYPWLRRQLAVRFIWEDITTLELQCPRRTAERVRARLFQKVGPVRPFTSWLQGPGRRRHPIPGVRQMSVPVGVLLGWPKSVWSRYSVVITYRDPRPVGA